MISFHGPDITAALLRAADFTRARDDGVITFIGAAVAYDDGGDGGSEEVTFTLIFDTCDKPCCAPETDEKAEAGRT